MLKLLKKIAVLIFLLLPNCYANDVVYMYSNEENDTVERMMVQKSCDFYMMKLAPIAVEKELSSQLKKFGLIRKDIEAIIVSPTVLNKKGAEGLIENIKSIVGERNVSILLFGIDEQVNNEILKTFTSNQIETITIDTSKMQDAFFSYSKEKKVLESLANIKLPIIIKKNVNCSFLKLRNEGFAKELISIRERTQNLKIPIFAYTEICKWKLFVSTNTSSFSLGKELTWHQSSKAMVKLSALIIFLNNSFRDRRWKMDSSMANLTIDDPWLRKSYGYINYKNLLNEMKIHNFHTTIGFIPWNFDRNEDSVVSLFIKNPERYSIVIHGNNHDHREFFNQKNKDEKNKSKNLKVEQEKDIKQAIARMRIMKNNTGLDYGKVMIFPHSIGPIGTLEILDSYGFIGTINENNIPTGIPDSKNNDLCLRNFNNDYANFLSIKRYSIRKWTKFKNEQYRKINNNIKTAFIIDLFLGNPIFLYGHHDIFQDGIDGFSQIAKDINEIDKNIQWMSLENITKRMYYSKKINESKSQILMLGNMIEIYNKEEHLR